MDNFSTTDRLITIIEGKAPEIWKMAVEQQKVDAWIGIAVYIVVAVSFLVAAKFAKAYIDSIENVTDQEGARIMFMAVGVIVVIAMAITAIIGGVETIKQLVNPEYYALIKLLK